MPKITKSPIAYTATTATIISTNIGTYMSTYLSSPYSRYRSHDYCHEVFVKYRKSVANPTTADYMALNLYMFLASWGMVSRGKLLIQNNYKLLIDAVKVVCDEKYDWLVDVDIYNPGFSKAKYLDDVMQLKEDLRKAIYKTGIGYKYDDTLLSKIILATLGCVPAYDTNVKKTMRTFGITASFNENGLKDLLDFANIYKSDIMTAMATYSGKTLVPYSPMKYIDMALW